MIEGYKRLHKYCWPSKECREQSLFETSKDEILCLLKKEILGLMRKDAAACSNSNPLSSRNDDPCYKRVEFDFPVSKQLFDLFFNGRYGYRGQYGLSVEEGDKFNDQIVNSIAQIIKKKTNLGGDPKDCTLNQVFDKTIGSGNPGMGKIWGQIPTPLGKSQEDWWAVRDPGNLVLSKCPSMEWKRFIPDRELASVKTEQDRAEIQELIYAGSISPGDEGFIVSAAWNPPDEKTVCQRLHRIKCWARSDEVKKFAKGRKIGTGCSKIKRARKQLAKTAMANLCWFGPRVYSPPEPWITVKGKWWKESGDKTGGTTSWIETEKKYRSLCLHKFGFT